MQCLGLRRRPPGSDRVGKLRSGAEGDIQEKKVKRGRLHCVQRPSFEGQERTAKWFRENVSTAFKEAREEAGLRRSSPPFPPSWILPGAGGGWKVGCGHQKGRPARGHQHLYVYVHVARKKRKSEVDDVFGDT